jgi:hypothetical protein
MNDNENAFWVEQHPPPHPALISFERAFSGELQERHLFWSYLVLHF